MVVKATEEVVVFAPLAGGTSFEPLDSSEVLTCVLVLSLCTTSSPGPLQGRLPVSMQ